ncbi:MAG: hypothetical protein ACK452_16370 [Bacteroidota bacterium]
MIRPIIFTFFVRLCSAVLNFLIIVILSQELGSEAKGICTKYITIVTNALIFCDLIGGPALVYLSAKYKPVSFLLPSYLWSILTSALTIYAFYIFGQIKSSELGFMLILSFLNSCIAIHQNILSGKQKFYHLNIVILLQSLLIFLSLQGLLKISSEYFNSNSPEIYVMALGFSWGISALIGFFFIISLDQSGEKMAIEKMITSAFRYGFLNVLGHFLQFFNQRLSYFLLPDKSLGVFSNATSIGESLWMISNSIATVQYGKISNMEDKIKAEKLSLLFFKINFLLCLLGAIALCFLPNNFFTWLFGSGFTGIHPILMWLSPGLVFYSCYLILGHHFSGRGEFHRNLYSIGCGLIITALGLLIVKLFFKDFNFIYAAAITSASYFGNFIVSLFLFKKEGSFSFKNFLIIREEFKLIKHLLKKTD